MFDAVVVTKTGCSGRGVDGFRNDRPKNDVYSQKHEYGEDVVELVLDVNFMYWLEYGNLVSS